MHELRRVRAAGRSNDDRMPMEAIMTETDGGALIVVALVLLALNAVRADACRAWLRDHLSPWWQRIRHH
jgi:hypothetical protein